MHQMYIHAVRRHAYIVHSQIHGFRWLHISFHFAVLRPVAEISNDDESGIGELCLNLATETSVIIAE